MSVSTNKYSSGMILVYSFFLFFLIFSGRGLSIHLDSLNISYGIIIIIPAIILFSKSIKFKYDLYDRFLIVSLMIFLVLGYFSLFYTRSFYYGLDKIFNLSAFIVSICLFLSALNKYEILKVFKFILLISAPLAIAYIALNVSTEFQMRQGLYGAGSITTGRVFSFACIISFFFATKDREKKMYLFCLLFIIAVFLSGSRGNFIFLIGSLILPWVLNNFRKIVKPIVILVLLVTILIKYSPIEKLPFFYRYALLFDGGGESINVRFDAYVLAYQLFIEHFLGGVGLGGYSYYTLGYDGIDYPHNLLIEIASELGVVGLSVFFTIILISFIIIRKNDLLLALFSFYLLVSMGSGDLFDARLLFAIALFQQSFNKGGASKSIPS